MRRTRRTNEARMAPSAVPWALTGLLLLPCLAFAAQPEMQDKKALMSEARRLAHEHFFLKARDVLTGLTARYPQDPAVHLEAAAIYYEMGYVPRAMDEYQKTRTIDPNNVEALIGLSQCALKNGNGPQALTLARQAAALSRSSMQAETLLLSALVACDRFKEADAILSKLTKSRPDDPNILYMAYRIYKERGEVSIARRYLEDAVRLKPDEISWMLDLADLYRVDQSPDKAKEVLESLLEKNPGWLEARKRLAELDEWDLHDYDSAHREYSRILVADPNNIKAIEGIERCRTRKNDLAGIWRDQLRIMVNRTFQR